MTTLKITRGYPASGKTTLALAWVNEAPLERARVNRDELRNALYGVYYGLAYSQEQAVTLAQQSAVEYLLRAGRDVIVDDTNLRLKHARAWADLAVRVGANFEVVDVTTERGECYARDIARRDEGQRFVGPDVIDSFASRYPMPWHEVRPTERKAGDQPAVYVPDTRLAPAWIVDIDGTVAAMDDRRRPHDYHLVGMDRPKEDVIGVVQALMADDYRIVVMSGRKDSCRDATVEWLDKHIGREYDGPFMRAADDNRPDFVVKAELFDQHVRHRYNVIGALDDRNQVVALWRSMGITCLQVADGNF